MRTVFEWGIRTSFPRVQQFYITNHSGFSLGSLRQEAAAVISLPADSQGLTDIWTEGFELTVAKAKLELGV